MKTVEHWKQAARKLKQKLYTIYLAYKDPRVPLYVKALAVLVVSYAFSPIDLIPDFIPVLGYLDDLILIPLGILLVLKLMPEKVVAAYEQRAHAMARGGKPKNWVVAAMIVLVWLVVGYWVYLMMSGM